MAYEPLAELIEKNLKKICREVAETAIARKLPLYSTGVGVEALTERLIPTVERIARYTRTGNPAEYRDYIAQVAQKRLEMGHSAEELGSIGDIIFEIIKQWVDRTFPGSSNQATRASFYRRLDGIHSLGRTTVVATRVKQGPRIVPSK
jgi:hypothetical protein